MPYIWPVCGRGRHGGTSALTEAGRWGRAASGPRGNAALRCACAPPCLPRHPLAFMHAHWGASPAPPPAPLNVLPPTHTHTHPPTHTNTRAPCTPPPLLTAGVPHVVDFVLLAGRVPKPPELRFVPLPPLVRQHLPALHAALHARAGSGAGAGAGGGLEERQAQHAGCVSGSPQAGRAGGVGGGGGALAAAGRAAGRRTR